VRVVKIGDGYVLLPEIRLAYAIDGDDLVAVFTVAGGRMSDLVPLDPKPVVLGEAGRVPLATIRKSLAGEEAADQPRPGIVLP